MRKTVLGVDKMIEFASYTFNKSHATAYAKLAYQMAKKSNSILVILGKGMETYQDINGENIGYSDIFELKRLIGK